MAAKAKAIVAATRAVQAVEAEMEAMTKPAEQVVAAAAVAAAPVMMVTVVAAVSMLEVAVVGLTEAARTSGARTPL